MKSKLGAEVCATFFSQRLGHLNQNPRYADSDLPVAAQPVVMGPPGEKAGKEWEIRSSDQAGSKSS